MYLETEIDFIIYILNMYYKIIETDNYNLVEFEEPKCVQVFL